MAQLSSSLSGLAEDLCTSCANTYCPIPPRTGVLTMRTHFPFPSFSCSNTSCTATHRHTCVAHLMIPHTDPNPHIPPQKHPHRCDALTSKVQHSTTVSRLHWSSPGSSAYLVTAPPPPPPSHPPRCAVLTSKTQHSTMASRLLCGDRWHRTWAGPMATGPSAVWTGTQ